MVQDGRRGLALRPLIFSGALGLLLVRFLLPVPVGQADNRDGPRLMCGAGFRLGPLYPAHYPRFFRYAYFPYAPSPECHTSGRPYPTSELVPLELARGLTRLLGLAGTINLVALGLIFCVAAATGITALATGLRVRPWAQIVIAAALWLIIADAAFFDVFASPFEEPAALTGLLLFAAGLLYLGRGWRSTLNGLALAGPGGIGVVVSKEQYVILALPVCATLILASAPRGTRGWRRYLTRQTYAATAVAALIAMAAGAYTVWDTQSWAGQRLQHLQTVDVVFVSIVNGHDNERADLRALHLPASWAKYAGKFYWAPGSVRTDPLFDRYKPEFTDLNVAHFLLTHPGRALGIANDAAIQANLVHASTLGDYPPGSGHPPGAYESRVAVVSWLTRQLSGNAGLAFLLPLWAALLATGLFALRRRPGQPWQRDGAVLVLCLTSCAMLAFIPPGFFDGISTTRHMVGENLATDLALTIAVALAGSMIGQAVAGRRRPGAGPAARRDAPGSAGQQPDRVLPRPRRDEPDVVHEPPALAGQQELAGARQRGDAVPDGLRVTADPLPGRSRVDDVGDLAGRRIDPGQERAPGQVGPYPAG
jgi:hypothetical protein